MIILNLKKSLYLLSLAAALIAAGSTAFSADWSIDKAHSHIGFEVKHLVISTVHGNFSDFTRVFFFYLFSQFINILSLILGLLVF